MSFPTVNGILIETDEDTSRSPMAVKRGRRSGRARATILRNEVETGIDASVLEEKEDGRKRERVEGRVGEDWGVGDDDVGARVAGLVTKKRQPCAKAYVGHGGYRLLVEGCGKERRTESARRVPTRLRSKLSIVCDDPCEPVSAEKKTRIRFGPGVPAANAAVRFGSAKRLSIMMICVLCHCTTVGSEFSGTICGSQSRRQRPNIECL